MVVRGLSKRVCVCLFVVYCVMLSSLFVVFALCFVCGRMFCSKFVYVCVIRV